MKFVKITKKITAIILTVFIIIIMFFSDIPKKNYIEVKAYSYNVEAAIAYAEAHWNDGQGLCAEFVSKCVQAGGINIPVKTVTIDAFNAVSIATGVKGQWLTLESNGWASRAKNGNILQRGDIVISWCESYQNGTAHSP
ncbi:MAG: hypothetical protein IJ054_07930, partial [Lachnospiraceae bacterium]|nr:hypothetical protein [Lachnospiraceae bacterium]